MKASSDVIDVLRRVPLFEDVSEPTLRVIASQMRPFEFPEGAPVIEEGKDAKFGRMYVIVSGTAEARVHDEPVAPLGPGDHFGEMSMLDGGPRSASVVATSELSTMGMSSWNMRGVLREHPELAVHVIQVLAGRLRAANERSLD